MCGICGIVSRSGAPESDLMLKMLGRLAHRGPDGSGYYRDESASLGHTRLAIIDAAGGAQPLSNEDGRIWISFNGEIFNYVELGDELRALGHTFRTASDTEVAVHAWEQWGPECFEKFNGQWSMALWDRLNGELVLSRDPAGILPLYYAFAGGRFLFASEIKAIFADPCVPRAFDPQGLNEIFSFWCTVAPRTPYEGVSELEPGHWAVLRNGKLQSRAYWEPRFPPEGREEGQDIVENGRRLREGLIKATRLRFLRSDVPVGAYLSGGIDSSVTAAIISRYTDAPLRTFSLRFSDAEFDEGHYQSEMADRLGTEHLSVEVTASDIARVFPEAVWHGEKPILRSGPAPLFLLSRFVRRSGYKVVVTGEGSDELLAGYDIFREARVRSFLARDPASAKRRRAAELLYPWMLRSPGKAPSFASAFFGMDLDPADPALSHRPRWNSTEAIRRMLRPEFLEATGASRPDKALIERMPPGHEAWDPISRAQWLEFSTLLPGYILSSQGDRMLMGNSVEGRFPFLDREVMDLANSFPSRHKLLGLDEKHILKREFADLLPEDILHRPKQPYRAPDAASFFKGPRPDWIEEATSEQAIKDAGIFESSAVASLFAKCTAVQGERMSNTDNMRVLAILSTQLTHLQFIAGDGAGQDKEAAPKPMLIIDMLKKIEQGERHEGHCDFRT
jgi:asparagine synthase (glutamine-hydrolysing)